MSTTNQQTFIQKYWLHLAFILLLITSVIQCNSHQKQEQAFSTLDKQAKEHQANASKYLADNEKLKADIPKYQDTINIVRKQSQQKDVKITQLKTAVQAKVEKIKTFKSIDVQSYIVDRYHVKPIDVPIVEQGVIFKDTISRLVITDLVKYDGTKTELVLTQGKLKDEQIINHQLTEANTNLTTQNNNSMLAISEKDQAFNAKAKEVIEEQVKTKKERNKKSFWQITTGVVAVVATTLLITK